MKKEQFDKLLEGIGGIRSECKDIADNCCDIANCCGMDTKDVSDAINELSEILRDKENAYELRDKERVYESNNNRLTKIQFLNLYKNMKYVLGVELKCIGRRMYFHYGRYMIYVYVSKIDSIFTETVYISETGPIFTDKKPHTNRSEQAARVDKEWDTEIIFFVKHGLKLLDYISMCLRDSDIICGTYLSSEWDYSEEEEEYAMLSMGCILKDVLKNKCNLDDHISIYKVLIESRIESIDESIKIETFRTNERIINEKAMSKLEDVDDDKEYTRLTSKYRAKRQKIQQIQGERYIECQYQTKFQNIIKDVERWLNDANK